MAYQVGVTCYDTPEAALDAIAASVSGSVVPSGYTNNIFVVSALRSGSSISYSITSINGTTTVSTKLITPSLSPCNLAGQEPFDYVSAGAIWTFFFAFVLSAWIVSKNAGVIINAVRRF